MEEVYIFKAQQTMKDVGVKSVTIVFDETIPSADSLDEADGFYQFDAELLEKTLHGILPGGTYDRLCSAMLKRKASHFRVSHKE